MSTQVVDLDVWVIPAARLRVAAEFPTPLAPLFRAASSAMVHGIPPHCKPMVDEVLRQAAIPDEAVHPTAADQAEPDFVAWLFEHHPDRVVHYVMRRLAIALRHLVDAPHAVYSRREARQALAALDAYTRLGGAA